MPPQLLRSTIAAGGGALSLVGSFLPWLQTGERRRSSYELAAVVRRLDLLSGSAAQWVVRVWPAVPLATVAAVAALVLFSGFISRLVAGAVALFVLMVAILVVRSPVEHLVGAYVTGAGAVMVMASALWRVRLWR